MPDDPFTYTPVPLVPFKKVKVRYVMKEDEKIDIDALIADVLAKHAAATPTPWSRDVDIITAAAEIDEFNGGEGYGMATLFRTGGSMRIPVGREQENADYAVAAANVAPVLAEELRRCREALKLAEVSMDTASIQGVFTILPPRYRESWAEAHKAVRAALAPKEPAHDQR